MDAQKQDRHGQPLLTRYLPARVSADSRSISAAPSEFPSLYLLYPDDLAFLCRSAVVCHRVTSEDRDDSD